MATAVMYLLAYLTSVAVSGYVVFSPIRLRLAAGTHGSSKFQLADIFAIFIPIQIGFAALNTVYADIKWYPLLAILVGSAFFMAILLVWICGLRLLSSLDVKGAAKRIVMLGIVMPLGFTLSATSFFAFVLAESKQQLLARFVFIAAGLVGLRWIGYWLLSRDSSDQHFSLKSYR